MGGTKYKHFYGNQSEQFTFYKVLKQLFVDEEFHNISAEAKLLYGILLDRMSLSSANSSFIMKMAKYLSSFLSRKYADEFRLC